MLQEFSLPHDHRNAGLHPSAIPSTLRGGLLRIVDQTSVASLHEDLAATSVPVESVPLWHTDNPWTSTGGNGSDTASSADVNALVDVPTHRVVVALPPERTEIRVSAARQRAASYGSSLAGVVTDKHGLTRLDTTASKQEQVKEATRALRLESLLNNEFVQRRAPAEVPVVKAMVQALVDAELRMALPNMADWLEHMQDWTKDPDAGWR